MSYHRHVAMMPHILLILSRSIFTSRFVHSKDKRFTNSQSQSIYIIHLRSESNLYTSKRSFSLLEIWIK
ncbi:hypothetical protein ScPMuIL_017509 [Solemya velum]